jgi:kynurenine 3-monooxygenase
MGTRGNCIVAGGGPVGALLAIVLARRGYSTQLFEARPDSRQTNIYEGKSINIALSDRGWTALESIGVASGLRDDAVPMYGRTIHGVDGSVSYQPYGRSGDAIWSVSRGGINERLLTIAESEPTLTANFDHKLVDLDFESAHATFQTPEGQVERAGADFVFGADGAYSKIRRLAQGRPRFSYSQTYMPQCYIELGIPAAADGSHQFEANSLHIWPRKQFMLIALPNTDGTFTCTLFLDFAGEPSFESLGNRADVQAFFEANFADAMPYLESPVEEFMAKDPAPLFLVQVYPWSFNNRIALIGDAAHAIVPFFGQGMNCGFEDCAALDTLIDTCDHDWNRIFPAYEKDRKPNADAIAELSKRNFVEMSDLSGDERFQLQKKIEARFHELHPEVWTPLYSMVTFSPQIPYAEALSIGDQQEQIMGEIMQLPGIEQDWQAPWVYDRMYELAVGRLGNNS